MNRAATSWWYSDVGTPIRAKSASPSTATHHRTSGPNGTVSVSIESLQTVEASEPSSTLRARSEPRPAWRAETARPGTTTATLAASCARAWSRKAGVRSSWTASTSRDTMLPTRAMAAAAIDSRLGDSPRRLKRSQARPAKRGDAATASSATRLGPTAGRRTPPRQTLRLMLRSGRLRRALLLTIVVAVLPITAVGSADLLGPTASASGHCESFLTTASRGSRCPQTTPQRRAQSCVPCVRSDVVPVPGQWWRRAAGTCEPQSGALFFWSRRAHPGDEVVPAGRLATGLDE